MFISAIKKQTDCSFYINKSLYGISQTWKSEIMREKKKINSIVLVYIADVSVNPSYIYGEH